MKFYTSVSRYGNQILYRGYKDGVRVQERIPYKPTLFVQSPKATGKYRTLTGAPVSPMEFDSMRDASDFYNRYKDAANFDVYGQTQFRHTVHCQLLSRCRSSLIVRR